MAVAQRSRLRRGLGLGRRLVQRGSGPLLTPWLGSIRSVNTREHIAALTFDDGPHPEYTPQLIEVLDKHKAKATFFIVGESAAAYPEVMRQLSQAGHTLANHSWNHPSLPLLPRHERVTQLRRCAQALAPYGGDNGLVRPPFGDQDKATRLDALRLGYDTVAWSAHAYDWLEHGPDFIGERLSEQLEPGSIFLLHDALYRVPELERRDRRAVIAAVDTFLGKHTDYEFVGVPELLRRGRAYKTLWFKRPDKAWLARFDESGTT